MPHIGKHSTQRKESSSRLSLSLMLSNSSFQSGILQAANWKWSSQVVVSRLASRFRPLPASFIDSFFVCGRCDQMFFFILRAITETHMGLPAHTGTQVVQVTATDADDPTYGNSARVIYSIIEGQPYFSVEPKTGNAISPDCMCPWGRNDLVMLLGLEVSMHPFLLCL